ncbi:MAG TPA: pyruvate kinase [Candidatus Nanoarchaeia archaeon]|nr:pyruvate kinase [Candidatus Nanoarchaeia archaeon]
MPLTAIVTVAPYCPFVEEIVNHPIVSGLRLNTAMKIKDKEGEIEKIVGRLQEEIKDKELYVDLKCRQLRVKNFGVPPFTEIELTHSISVDTPVTAYFSDGQEYATVLQVEGNKLFMQEGPKRVVGPGESVNIPHPSLKVEGYLTYRDREYVKAGSAAGVHKYMLSFFEQPNDDAELLSLDPQAEPVYKIESIRGLHHVQKYFSGKGRLMAGRGDLYVELKMPHHIIEAMETIIQKDPKAIAASRILKSFSNSYMPECQDMGDVDSLVRMGYRTLMLGDDVCMKRESVLSALNLLKGMAEYYQGRNFLK